MRSKDIDILVRTAYGEARGEGMDGMRAVMHSIKNRADKGSWWGKTIYAVAKYPYQYSAWNKGDPNRAIMENMNINDYPYLVQMAKDVIDGTSTDPTHGATHYHTPAVNPRWKDTTKITVVIGKHTFYKEIA